MSAGLNQSFLATFSIRCLLRRKSSLAQNHAGSKMTRSKALSLSQAARMLEVGQGSRSYEEALPRVKIPLSRLSPQTLRRKGFTPTWLAIPEPGQATQLSWRGPDGVHLHRHSTAWIAHKDRHAPVGLSQTATHIVTEGVPGLVRYVKHSLSGGGPLERLI